MAFDREHLGLQMSGRMPGDEIWSCSLRLARGDISPAVQPSDLQPWADAVETWFTSAGASIANTCTLELLKVNRLSVEGRYLSDGLTNQYEYPTPYPTGETTRITPNQITSAVTLTTDAQRGLAVRGRIYPPLALGTLTGGRMQESSCLAMANAMATLINTLNTLQQGYTVRVMSNVGNGLTRPVTGVRVGRVPDTQRRRRNALLEEPVPATTAIVGL